MTRAAPWSRSSEQAGRSSQDLVSQKVVTDGQWHRVGLTWDGTNRVLYVDGTEVARDTQGTPIGSTGGLNIGSARTPGTFWSGLIDDVRLSTPRRQAVGSRS